MKKAIVFDPYLNILGGGEVYTSTVIGCLLANNYQVDILWKDPNIKSPIKKFLGIDISQANINIYGYGLYSKKSNFVKKRNFSKDYDLSFFVSDGSIPWLFCDKNILHFQIPFSHSNGKTLQNKLKLKNIHHIICNSDFTNKFIDKTYGVFSKIIHPPINIKKITRKKKNNILAVGRFTSSLHNKRQDVLVDSFKKLVDQGLSDWKLILIGSNKEKEGKEMVSFLKQRSKGYPIEFHTNISHNSLESEYAKAKIFWHAAGYGIDENVNPEKVEHFGISTVEAMVAGCVPVIINKGGLKESVTNQKNGFLWNSPEELLNITSKLIQDEKLLITTSRSSRKIERKFSKTRFFREFKQITNI